MCAHVTCLPLVGLKAWLSHQTSGSPKRLHPNLRFEPGMLSFFGSENLEKDVEKPWKNTISICRDHFPKRFPHGFSPSGISIHSECSFVSSLNFNMSCTRNHQKSLILGEDNSHFFQEWYLNFQSNPPTHISWWNAHMLIETRTLLIKKLHVLPVKPPVPSRPLNPQTPSPSSFNLVMSVSHLPVAKDEVVFWKTGIQPAKKWWVMLMNI